jgi:flagellar protein FliO/FliZ
MASQPRSGTSDYPVAVRIGRRPPSRAHGYARLLTAILVAASLRVPAQAAFAAGAGDFERDDTPLPSGVTSGGEEDEEAESGASGGIVRMIVGLAIVLAVIYGVYWLLKAYRKSKLTSGDGRIEVVATTPLAPNRAVHLIRVGDELVLVGSAEQGVTPLRVYGPGETAELEPLLEAMGAAPRGAPSRGGLALSRSKGGADSRSVRADAGGGTVAKAIESARWRTVRR